MKKAFLLICLVVIGASAFSQDLRFTKGETVPGKLESARAYEDFISGKINVTDNMGNVYTFIKAEFTLLTRQGKKVGFAIQKVWFDEEQSKSIVVADDEGTVYTFSNIIVKDSNGKVFTLRDVSFEYPSLSRGY